jgi:Ca2+-binding RTX toxin-like protein
MIMMRHFGRHLVRAVAATVFIVAIGPVPLAEAAPPLCFDAGATIVGTEGDDVLTGTPGPDVIVGLGGADTLRGKDGDDTICGGDGNDLLSGGEAIDKVDGGAGADDLRLGPNPCREGSDEGQLTYICDYADGGSGDDTIDGGSGSDWINGGSGNDRIDGGPGGDWMSGNEGDDVMRGGKGDDAFGPEDEFGFVREDPGNDTAFGGPGGDSWIGTGAGSGAGHEDHFYGGTGNDGAWVHPGVGEGSESRFILRGEAGDDELSGGNGADVILGGTGNDHLKGYGGDDSLRGGSGTDTVNFWAEGPVRVDLQLGRATAVGGLDTLSSVEGVIGSAAKDVLLGSHGADIFWFGGNDIGGGEAVEGDVINGRRGRDTLRPEVFDSYSGIHVDLAAGHARFISSEQPATISSIEIVIGTDTPNYHDVLLGDEHANTLRGGAGDDTISGRGGRDRLAGGPGRDNLRGGAGRDVLSGGSGADDLGGGSGRDRNYGGSGQDRCTSPAAGRLARSCELH